MYADRLALTLEQCVLNTMPVMVHGPAGGGKSSIVRQVQKKIARENEIDFGLIDVRLSQMEPSDIRGVMWPSKDKQSSVWLTPSFLPQDPEWTGILFLDEINNAPPLVQSAAYQLILDRRIGEYQLPEGVAIVAAGNRMSDKGVFFKMPAPLANRLIHMTLELSADVWKLWAYANGIHPDVISFISFRKEAALHNFNPSSDSPAFASPRTWEYTSDILSWEIGESEKFDLFCGAIGDGLATEFSAYRQISKELVPVETILDLGQDYTLPIQEDVSIVHAINTALVYHFQNLKRRLREPEILAVYRYLNKIPHEDIAFASFKEFTGNKIDINGSLSEKANTVFATFFDRIKDLIPKAV